MTNVNKKSVKQVASSAKTTMRVLANETKAGMAKAEDLRTKASEFHQQFEIQGRKAMIGLMSEIYTLYSSQKARPNGDKAFFDHVKSLIDNSQVRKTSSDASVLVRYICSDMDDKQISIYSRSIALAHKNQVASGGFAALLENTEGGFSGVVNKFSEPVKPSGAAGSNAAMAEKSIHQELTVATVDATGWKNNETVRVFIATYNDDGSADLKDAQLSEKSIDAVLLRYAADKKLREQPDKENSAENIKHELLALRGAAANSSLKAEELRLDMNAAVLKSEFERAANLRISLQLAEIEAEAYNKAVKAKTSKLAKLEAAE